MSEYEVNGTAVVHEEVGLVVMDQEIEIGIDDVRILRVGLAVNEFKEAITNTLDTVITDPSQDYIQIDIPLTAVFTFIKK